MSLKSILSFDHHPAVVGLVDAARGLFGIMILVIAYRLVTGISYTHGIGAWSFVLLSVPVICYVIGVGSSYVLKESTYLMSLHRVRSSLIGATATAVAFDVLAGIFSADWSPRTMAILAILAIPSGAVLGDRLLSLRDPHGIAKLLRRGENVQAHLRLKDYVNRPH